MDCTADTSQLDQQWYCQFLTASLSVHTRKQFFAWLQGPAQRLVPHEILICGLQECPDGLRVEHFSTSRYFRADHLAAACHPGSGLISEALKLWRQGCLPVMLGGRYRSGPATEPPEDIRLKRLELRNLALHAQLWSDGSLKGYIAFARLPCELDVHLSDRLRLIAPVLIQTLAQILAYEQTSARKPGILTRRELEIIEQVREGRSNPDIAARLNLSPLTVKNHIRNILRKLHARTRGQAVTMAISTGLLVAHSGFHDTTQSAEPMALGAE